MALPEPVGKVRFTRDWASFGVSVHVCPKTDSRGMYYGGFFSHYLHREGFGVWERDDIKAICWRFLGAA